MRASLIILPAVITLKLVLQVNELGFFLVDIVQKGLLLVLDELDPLRQGGRSGFDHVVVLLNLLYTHSGFAQTSKKDQPINLVIGIQPIVLFVADNRIEQTLSFIKADCPYVKPYFCGDLSYRKNLNHFLTFSVDLHLV